MLNVNIKLWVGCEPLSGSGVAFVVGANINVYVCELDFIAGDFPRAWALLLEFIESGALCRNAEVSLAALKSFQEILQLNKDSNKSDDWKLIFGEFISILDHLPNVLWTEFNRLNYDVARKVMNR